MEIEAVAAIIVDTAFTIHVGLGPGLLESVYLTILAEELQKRGLHIQRQVAVPFKFNGIQFDDGLRVDLLVERCIVVELKSIEKLAPVHYKQVLTYLRLLDLRLGFLINFGEATLKAGIRRIVNRYEQS